MEKVILLLSCMLTGMTEAKTAEAIFAGGNFWYAQANFNQLPGVLATITGFDGGTSQDPTYEEVQNGRSNYVQAVRIIYDPDRLRYKTIVDYFWRMIDPTVKNAQFCDIGPQYQSAIFYLNAKQKQIAELSKDELRKKFKNVYTQIVPSTQFYAAEGEQQAFNESHPFRYTYYLYHCGQAERVEELWRPNYN